MPLTNAGPSDYAGPSNSAEMRQKNGDNVHLFAARPATYYGDGPFDPPSSEDDNDDEAEGGHHSSEADAESDLLLNVDRSGPSTPGRAERGDQSPTAEQVRSLNGGFFWKRQWILVYL